jgi:hypothetical protein
VIEAIPASNDVNLPGLATTETLTRHVNLNYFSEAVSWEGEERLADADSWRITGKPEVIPINSTAPLLPADNTLVARVPKDGGVQLRLACRKRDKGRQSGHRGQ